MAGRVLNVDILMDHSNKSKGLGEVQFEDPNDAIGAIGEPDKTGHFDKGIICCHDLYFTALFHGQMLMDRPMTVRMVGLQTTYRFHLTLCCV